MIHLGLFDSQIVAQNVINGADSFPLMAVPFFMLAGEVMNTGGLSRRIVDLAMALVGHIRGGLGFVVILAACLLSSLSGSALADAAALSALLLPMMLKSGHGAARSGGLIASAGIIGADHPAQHRLHPVRRRRRRLDHQAVPGRHRARPDDRRWPSASPGCWWPGASRSTCRRAAAAAERLRALIDSLWAMMLPVIIVVGLKFGVFTPTEAGVVAAVYSLFVAMVVYRELKLGPALRRVRLRRQDHRRGDVPGRRRRGLGLADHRRRPARPAGRHARPVHGQPDRC